MRIKLLCTHGTHATVFSTYVTLLLLLLRTTIETWSLEYTLYTRYIKDIQFKNISIGKNNEYVLIHIAHIFVTDTILSTLTTHI